MRLKDVKVGFAITGSHCTIGRVLKEIKRIVREDGAEIFPIVSETVNCTDTRFGKALQWKEKLVEITGRSIITTIVEAEQIGPGRLFDILVLAPCTGNTMAKFAHGVTDSPVLMAAKAQLRNERPVVIAISTNDGLGLNAHNLGLLLNTKNVFFVPFGQDNPFDKANSLVAHMDKITDTILEALMGRQIQPLLVEYKVRKQDHELKLPEVKQ